MVAKKTCIKKDSNNVEKIQVLQLLHDSLVMCIHGWKLNFEIF